MDKTDQHDWQKEQEEEVKKQYDKKHMQKARKKYWRFVWGGLSGLGVAFYVQPMQLIKTKMQMCGLRLTKKKRPTTVQVFTKVYQNDGVYGFYRGISCSVVRQLAYTGARFGLYSYFIDLYVADQGRQPSFGKKCQFGMVSGAIGGFVSVPAEVAFIRMTADQQLPYINRKHYHNVGDVFWKIIQAEGIRVLWQGTVPTVIRSMIINSTQLSVYSELKQKLLGKKYFRKDNKRLQAMSSLSSGLLTTIISAPIDLVKTRMQCKAALPEYAEYRGTLDTLLRVSREEGVFSLWKGFTPYSIHMMPHTVMVFMLFEQLNHRYGGTMVF